MSVEIRLSTLDDAIDVARHMRVADMREIYLSNKILPFESLSQSLERSVYCRTVAIDGTPAAMFGVMPFRVLGSLGVPWLLATDALCSLRKALVRDAVIYVEEMQSLYPDLLNFVHTDNAMSRKWLRTLDFDVADEPEPIGPFDALFHRFERHAYV